MPSASDFSSTSGRGARDTRLRQFAFWLVETGYAIALPLLTLVALGIAVYAFIQSFGEGARSIIFYVIPVMWGAYALAVNDGKPQAITQVAQTVVIGISVVAALIIGSVIFFKAPISIADFALGTMAAFFFLMWTSDQATPYIRRPSDSARIWMLALLIMVTILAVFAAVSL